MPIPIRNWFITAVTYKDPYLPPEYKPTCLAGDIDSHPELDITPDMQAVTTSPIVSAQGRVVQTESGRYYELSGEPSPYFHDFLKLKGIEFDEANPLHIINVKGFLNS
jgi:hypothetical protein